MDDFLKRPLIIFDLETTGTSPKKDRVVEIAALKIYPDQSEEEFESLVNPEMPIPEPASRVHGITDEIVSSAPTLAELGEEILEFFYDCDYAGFNCAKFDVPLLQNECDRVGIPLNLEAGHIVDAFLIFKHYERHTLTDAFRFYVGGEIENAHEAMADVRATWEVIEGQVKRYRLPWDAAEISGSLKPPGALDDDGKLREIDGVPTLMFGKHKDTPLDKVPKSYVSWLLRKQVMPSASHILEARLRPPKKGK
jgi:DNA polymerase-3 subunit epsilon